MRQIEIVKSLTQCLLYIILLFFPQAMYLLITTHNTHVPTRTYKAPWAGLRNCVSNLRQERAWFVQWPLRCAGVNNGLSIMSAPRMPAASLWWHFAAKTEGIFSLSLKWWLTCYPPSFLTVFPSTLLRLSKDTAELYVLTAGGTYSVAWRRTGTNRSIHK